MIITKLTKYIGAVVGNTAKGIINVNHKAIIEVHFKVIAKRSAIFIRSQIAS